MKLVVIRVDPERRAWWKETMSALAPEFKFVLWDEDEFEKGKVEYAIVWAPPHGMLASLPKLKCVFSVGAGVSHITEDPTFPKDIPIVRTTGPALRQRMCEYVALHVLRIHRRLPEIEAAAANREWKQFVEPTANSTTVGLLGVGNLGGAVGSTLKALGYKVKGLTRRGNRQADFPVFARNELGMFVENVDILISLLPGTPDTDRILNKKLFSIMKRGSWVINVGRGSQVDDDELLEALDTDILSGAVLDVFRTEPLPPTHPFWFHPKILITSHTASAIEPAVGGEIIARNLKDVAAGRPVADLVDMKQGY